MRSNQNLRVFWKPVNPQEIPLPQAMKIQAAKAAVDKECEKLEKIPAWDLTKVRRKKKGDR